MWKPKEGLLKRTKRRWSPPPFNILENDPGPYPKEIERVITHAMYCNVAGLSSGWEESPEGKWQELPLPWVCKYLQQPMWNSNFSHFSFQMYKHYWCFFLIYSLIIIIININNNSSVLMHDQHWGHGFYQSLMHCFNWKYASSNQPPI